MSRCPRCEGTGKLPNGISIRRARGKRSRRQAAKLAGLSHTYYTKLEGSLTVPIATHRRILAALDRE